MDHLCAANSNIFKKTHFYSWVYHFVFEITCMQFWCSCMIVCNDWAESTGIVFIPKAIILFCCFRLWTSHCKCVIFIFLFAFENVKVTQGRNIYFLPTFLHTTYHCAIKYWIILFGKEALAWLNNILLLWASHSYHKWINVMFLFGCVVSPAMCICYQEKMTIKQVQKY